MLLLQAFQAEAYCLGSVAQAQGSADKELLTALWATQTQPEVEWTVATLAGIAFMSRSVFARRSEQMFGVSPMRYLRERRLTQAKAALRNGLPVKHVAARVATVQKRHSARPFTTASNELPTASGAAGIKVSRTLEDYSGTRENLRSSPAPIY